MSKMSKMRLYIQTKSLSGWQTVASFTNQAKATDAYQHVFRGLQRRRALGGKSIRRAGKGAARQGRHSGLDPWGPLGARRSRECRSVRGIHEAKHTL